MSVGVQAAAEELRCGCGWPERDCAIRAWGNKPDENMHLECGARDAAAAAAGEAT